MNKFTTLIFLLFLLITSCGTRSVSKKDVVTKRKWPKPILVIDAGHGGLDPGGINNAYKIYEKDVTRVIVDAIINAIDTGRIKVVETRLKDENINRHVRIKNANEFKPNLLITIHTNFDDNAAINGLEVAYSDSIVKEMNKTHTLYCINPNRQLLKDYTQILSRDIGNAFPTMRVRRSKDRCDHIWMICAPTCPSMLVEFGFISNKKDVGIMRDPKAIQKLATTITQSIYTMLSI